MLPDRSFQFEFPWRKGMLVLVASKKSDGLDSWKCEGEKKDFNS